MDGLTWHKSRLQLRRQVESAPPTPYRIRPAARPPDVHSMNAANGFGPNSIKQEEEYKHSFQIWSQGYWQVVWRFRHLLSLDLHPNNTHTHTHLFPKQNIKFGATPPPLPSSSSSSSSTPINHQTHFSADGDDITLGQSEQSMQNSEQFPLQHMSNQKRLHLQLAIIVCCVASGWSTCCWPQIVFLRATRNIFVCDGFP